jgi:hypothetical protein
MTAIVAPLPQFFDITGLPLNAGYVWVGLPNQNPETAPASVYWDDALTQPAEQPLRTSLGRIVRSGTAAPVYVSGDYSLLVKNAAGVQVDYARSAAAVNNGLAVGTLRDDLASTASGKGAALMGFSHANTYAQGTAGLALQAFINVKNAPFNAVGDGTTDDTAAIQAALNAAAGRNVYVPAGTYRITSTLTYEPASYDGAFGPALKLYGDGPLKTYFDNQVSGGPLLSVETASTVSEFKGAIGGVLDGFTIKRTGSTTGGIGLRVLTAYNQQISNVHIIGMTSHGISLPCVLGDNDASNMLELNQVRIENCAGWGIKADGDSGRNEGSFFRFQQVFVQACGTASGAATPPSGGMIWKGQILKMDQCAFTLNENCALFIPGQAGLGQTADMQNTTFENNNKRNIYCTGISAFKARNIQQYHNDTFIGTVGVEFDGASFVVRQVDIDGCVVRATSGNNAFTAFKISGANADLQSCRVRRVVWDNFDYTGQTRFNGWLFDPVMPACDVVVLNSTTVFLRANQTMPKGSAMPLRLRGGIGGAPSTSGEWIAYQVPNPGLTISNSGLSNSTRYYVYLYDNNGAPSLELSTTAFAFDTATGYAIKSGDATRTYCGSVITNGSAAFETTASGWLNPILVPGTQTGAYVYMWADASNRLRVRYPLPPASDTDGTIVGTQS